jgi:quinoprotein glucose dehydrogenase
MRRLLLATSVSLAFSAPANDGDWVAYGHDAFGSRYSPLTQIDRTNVTRLEVAWTYRTGERDIETRRQIKFEATPLVIDGVMYLSTPLGKAIALDAATGAMRWTYDSHMDPKENFGDFASRGVSYWMDPRAARGARCSRRIILPTIDARLIALDAATGKPCASFGDSGTVNLRRNLHNAPHERAEYEITSPPAVIRGTLVVGSAIADNNNTVAASGEVRGIDARTGAVKWTWDPVPRDSTDPQYGTWLGWMAHATGAANAWSVIAADSARDLVFVPTSSPSPDYYGGERVGDNRYANSIVALRASTGKVVWHFQAVHHDLWDDDLASPPALVTITHEGRRRDVVLQTGKSAQLFVLDRDTGEPVFPVEERPVPKTTVAGEHVSPTQPFNTVLPPLSPYSISLDSIAGFSAEDKASCLAQMRGLRNEGVFTPPSLEGSLQIPSNVGGAHWGGLAFDRQREIAVIPVNRLVTSIQLIPIDRFDRDAQSQGQRMGAEYSRMHGTPFIVRRAILRSARGVPCAAPPWGSLVAIDLKGGKKLWDVPLGDLFALGDSAAASAPHQAVGSPNLGGPIVTASGIVFIAAAMDRKLRAFDVETGRELWSGRLPAGARATPSTYLAGGRQYVVVCVGGGDEWGKGDYVVAFALGR